MRHRHAGRRYSLYGLCYGLLIVFCLSTSACATSGGASGSDSSQVAEQDANADAGTADERGNDDGEWRELDTDKDEEAAVATVWLISGLLAAALSILGTLALF